MGNGRGGIPGVLFGSLALLVGSGSAFAGDSAVIVGFKTAVDASVVTRNGGTSDGELEGVKALAARVPASAVAALRSDPAVAYVEEDGVVEASGKGGSGGGGGDKGGGKPGPSQPAQTTPWGVTRVGAPLTGNVGAGVKVAVIDTGIDLTHPDLEDNVTSGANFVKGGGAADDDNGHGSHVAGIIAAVNNTIGVVGVAPGASLYAVKVLDRRGSGTFSAVVSGISWAAGNGMNVANMSLGAGSGSAAMEDACDAAAAAGVLLVAAAGNEGDGNTSSTELSYPAAYGSVVAVGATSASDALASFSNTGSFVELSGPGVSVPSTYKDGGYATLSGTSMASPHAAGVAALIWNDITGPTAASVRSELQSRARDAGPAGRDNGFGCGIVYFP